MKILKVFFSLFLFVAFLGQLKAQDMVLPNWGSPSSNCDIWMTFETTSATTNTNPDENPCMKYTVHSATPQDLFIGYDHCRKESEGPVTSLTIVLCFGENSCGPTAEDGEYRVDCGVQDIKCREGCDVIIAGGQVIIGGEVVGP